MCSQAHPHLIDLNAFVITSGGKNLALQCLLVRIAFEFSFSFDVWSHLSKACCTLLVAKNHWGDQF